MTGGSGVDAFIEGGGLKKGEQEFVIVFEVVEEVGDFDIFIMDGDDLETGRIGGEAGTLIAIGLPGIARIICTGDIKFMTGDIEGDVFVAGGHGIGDLRFRISDFGFTIWDRSDGTSTGSVTGTSIRQGGTGRLSGQG